MLAVYGQRRRALSGAELASMAIGRLAVGSALLPTALLAW